MIDRVIASLAFAFGSGLGTLTSGVRAGKNEKEQTNEKSKESDVNTIKNVRKS